jgi:hypothetical protein
MNIVVSCILLRVDCVEASMAVNPGPSSSSSSSNNVVVVVAAAVDPLSRVEQLLGAAITEAWP